MMDDVKKSLCELHLPSKEVDVYLAMLELGPASVQEIAKKAGINRTTTYVMFEGLKRRGLISTFEKGKKTLFAAENPERLLALVAHELNDVEARKQRLEAQLPRLLAIFNAVEDKPKVRFFEGEEGMDLVRREVAALGNQVWVFFAVDEALLRLSRVHEASRVEATKRLSGRMLLAIKPGLHPPYFDPKRLEVRTVDYNVLPFSGEFAVAGSRTYLFIAQSSGLGVIIESAEAAELFRALYAAAWNCGKPWTPPAGWRP